MSEEEMLLSEDEFCDDMETEEEEDFMEVNSLGEIVDAISSCSFQIDLIIDDLKYEVERLVRYNYMKESETIILDQAILQMEHVKKAVNIFIDQLESKM